MTEGAATAHRHVPRTDVGFERKERMMNRGTALTAVALAVMLGRLVALRAGDAEKTKKKAIPQTTCPVMGGTINTKLYVDHGGKRIYVCCAGCIAPIKKSPAKYIKVLESQGVTLARTTELCAGCGEIKGTARCCKPKGRVTCAGCGLFKGSPGCCAIPKGAKPPVVLCTGCGEIKGTARCCKPADRAKCAGCGLFKGSPGCCAIRQAGHTRSRP